MISLPTSGRERVRPRSCAQEPGRDRLGGGRGQAVGAPTRLTDEQERAIARRGEPLLLAAGAGSGKTSVLVERFVRAVREDGLAPGRILAITFTERAAGELRERVRERFLALGDREAARDVEAALVSTFHGFCARLLRVHPLLAGLDPEFSILEEGFARSMRERAFSIALWDFLKGERAPAVDLLAAYGVDRVRAMVEGAYAELRSRGEARPRLPGARPRSAAHAGLTHEHGAGLQQAYLGDVAARSACALLDELLDGFGGAYEVLKRARGAVDFDDLELRAGELLRSSESVRGVWSARFELLMVDEFQDTNPRQLAILTALERGNLFTVGDELQSIYGFRDADVGLFRARRAQLAKRGQTLELTRNFRSRPPLLDVINAVFGARFGPAYAPLVPGREADGESHAGADPPVELLLTSRRGWEEAPGPPSAAGVPRWRAAEARMLAERVAELVRGGGARAGEVAVLLRALGDVEVYERALQESGLRTLAAVGGFWGRQQVGDLLAYLRALANPLDELALYGTLASPLVGISSDGLALLARAARERGSGQVWATVQDGPPELFARLPGTDRDALVEFRGRLQAERRAAPTRSISQLIERAIDASGYREHVLGLEWGERRLANVHKLLRLARQFEASEGRDLRAFLDHVAQREAQGSGPEPDAPLAGVEPDAVRLMSIHAAKGLEFPVVCVADLGRTQNLGVPDLLVDRDSIGLRLVRLDGAESTPSLEFQRLSQERKQAQAEEEERILYVAMTRARERLILSGAVDFERWPEERQGAPTVGWLGRALAPELPEITRAHLCARQGPVFDLAVGRNGGRVRLRLGAPCNAQNEQLHLPLPSPQSAAGLTEPRERDTGASARGGDPLQRVGSLSYTTLSELERCGYRYYLERVLGMEENRAAERGGVARAGLQARVRGTLAHRLLESVDFARGAAPTSQDVAKIARELGVRVGRADRAELAALVGTAVAAVSGPADAASRLGPAMRVGAAVSVRREHPFALSVGPREPLITGVIDLLAREADGGSLVLDYKTDRVGPQEDLARLVESEYVLQRVLYALAVLREGAPKVEIVHWFLERPRDWVGARYAAADREGLERGLAERLRDARTRAFKVSEQPHRGLCETCPGRGTLCSWSEAETSREAPLR